MSAALASAPPRAGPPPPALVNKRDLARILDIAPKTLDDWIARSPDFPVVKGGARGIGYLFDPIAVRAFLRRAEATTPKSASSQDRVAEARAALLEQQLAVRSRELVSAIAMQHAATTAFATLGRTMQGLASQLGRRHGLSDELIRELRASLADAQRALVAEIERALETPIEDTDPDAA
jgi:hypothetical protein